MEPQKSPLQNLAQLEHGRLTTLINSMADGVIAVDHEVKVVLYNGAALNILDINESIENTPLAHACRLIDAAGQPIDIEQLVKNTSIPTVNRDMCLKYADGSVINLYLSIAPVRLGYGETGDKGYVLMMRDITREKSLEEERNEFISVVSHELRTPVAITEGDVSNAEFIAEKTGSSEEIKKALKEAHNQVLFLAEMINDLSTLSRAERGILTLEVEAIDVQALLDEIKSSYQPQAELKGLVLRTVAANQLQPLFSSRLYVREILQNFVTNALKYTQEGSVTITATSHENGIEIAVSDTGIGISKQDKQRVFEKFFRSEDYRTRASNGTGLGLYVTMKLVKLIKADITVDSELNKGSTFRVFIPNLEPTKKPHHAASQPPAPPNAERSKNQST